MTANFESFTKSAKDLSRNPLGIIALFIVLVYGFACLLFGFSSESLSADEKTPLIWFIIIFPVLILFLFGWLVSGHHDKLYSPSDYRDDRSFLTTLQQRSSKNHKTIENSNQRIDDLMKYGEGYKAIDEQETIIKKDLEARNLEYSSETAKALIRQVSAFQFLYWFEKAYSLIFGSQISLLRKLSITQDGMELDAISAYISEVRETFSDALDNWSDQKYLEYLFETKLIEEKDNRLSITTLGSDFLRLLDESNYPNKNF